MAASKLGDYLTSINRSKVNVMRDPNAEPQVITGYPAFMIRRLMSYHMDTVLLANEMNLLPHLDNQMQYEFLLHSVPKKNRYATTHKVQNPDSVELIKEYYKYSDEKALEVVGLHTPDDFARMKEHLSEGGLVREK
jgi:hypothetical protein